MLRLKEGEAVQIADRVATPADLKSGLFYNHYRKLNGTVFKLYGTGETQQAAIDVDLTSLPADIVARHGDTREQMRATLTGDAKRQSGPGGEQEFRLRYVVLVATADLARPKRN